MSRFVQKLFLFFLAHIFTKKYLDKFGPVFLTKLSVKSFSPLYPCELSAYVLSIHY